MKPGAHVLLAEPAGHVTAPQFEDTLGFAARADGLGPHVGLALARGLAERLFHVSLSPTWWTLPAVAFAGMALAVTATMVPVRIVRRVQPATVLKGE